MGVRARTVGWGGWGWSPDGSDMGVINPNGSPQFTPAEFSRDSEGGRKAAIHNIETNQGTWVHDKKAVPKAIEGFIKMVRHLESQGVSVVSYFPPLAPEVYKKVREFSDEYSYITEAKRQFAASNIKVYDLENPEIMGLKDCHFSGDLHFASFAAATILKTLVDMDKSGTIGRYVDMDYIVKNLEKYSNITTVVDRRKPEWNETEAFRHFCIFDKSTS